MDTTLKNALINAAKNNVTNIYNHVERDKKKEKNNHTHIVNFQNGVLQDLSQTLCNDNWEWNVEQTKDGQKYRDSVDILGKKVGRNCIIEIDAVRHDQIAAKFVSRLAIWGLDGEPIDYVAILYKSTQDSGRQSAEKYVQYIYDILKKINPNSSLLGIYIDTNKNTIEVWDHEVQEFSISGVNYNDMNKCARAAIESYIRNNKSTTFNNLRNVFARTRRYASYIFEEEGGIRAKKIDNLQTSDGKDVYVYSQFRSSNWDQFVEVCKKNGINIEKKRASRS